MPRARISSALPEIDPPAVDAPADALCPSSIGIPRPAARSRCRAFRRRRRWPPRAGARCRARPPRRAAAPRPRSTLRRRSIAVSRGRPSVSVPVLSTTSVSTRASSSSASAFLISTPALRAAAGADHDGHRRRQTERAGAGDDQDRHGADQRVREARLRPEDGPGRRTSIAATSITAGTKYAGDAIGEPLNRRARALRLGDHPHDLREQRVAADALGASS